MITIFSLGVLKGTIFDDVFSVQIQQEPEFFCQTDTGSYSKGVDVTSGWLVLRLVFQGDAFMRFLEQNKRNTYGAKNEKQREKTYLNLSR